MINGQAILLFNKWEVGSGALNLFSHEKRLQNHRSKKKASEESSEAFLWLVLATVVVAVESATEKRREVAGV